MGKRVEQLPAALDRRRALAQQRIDRASRPLRQRGHALALPADAAAMGVGVRPQARGEAHVGRRQPFAPAQPRDVLRAFCPLAQGRDQLAAAVHPRAQDLRAEPAGDA